MGQQVISSTREWTPKCLKINLVWPWTVFCLIPSWLEITFRDMPRMSWLINLSPETQTTKFTKHHESQGAPD